MVDSLNNSRPLDVHVWSDYPEINHLVDALWETYFEPVEVGGVVCYPIPNLEGNEMKSALLTALMTTSFLLAGCNSTNITKSAINQFARANGVQVAYDPNSSFGKGLPTKREFNQRYGRDNCALATYMEMRGKYISIQDVLVGMAKSEGVDQPGMSARLMRVDIGSSNISISPETTNTFYVDELEGSQGFGSYKIAVTAKGFRCKIINYTETKL